MIASNKYQAYAAATQTVAKTRQIVMLYDGAIRFLQQAKEAMNEKRIEDRYHLLVRASNIVVGLQSCLDFERGGDIAKVLYQFYASIEMRIYALHYNNSVEACNEVIDSLKQMRDVWHEIDQSTASASGEAVSAASKEASLAASTTGTPVVTSVAFTA